jgi:hypothetical protein
LGIPYSLYDLIYALTASAPIGLAYQAHRRTGIAFVAIVRNTRVSLHRFCGYPRNLKRTNRTAPWLR